MKFYKCAHCGNVAVKLHDAGVPLVCCGEKMSELVAGTTDGAAEKHVPVVRQEKNKIIVDVGSVKHPSMNEHYISFIALETDREKRIVELKPGDDPHAEFVLSDGEKMVAVYEYCNLHGLWKA